MDTKKKYQQKLDEKLENGYELDYRQFIDRGLQLFKAAPRFYIAFTGILLLAAFISVQVETAGFLISVFVTPALTAGFFLTAQKTDNGEQMTFRNFWEGFNFWLNLASASVIRGFLIMLGIMLLVIPGIYLSVAYIFIIPFIVLAGFEFWEAMEASRKLITRNFWNILVFLLLLAAINLAGLLALGVGALVTIPISFLAIYAAFVSILPVKEEDEKKTSKDPTQLDLSMFR